MTQSIYDKHHPYHAKIKSRTTLNKPGSKKNTQHLVLDLGASAIQYNAGDSIGIFPTHDKELVQKTLDAMKMTGHEQIQSKGSSEWISLEEFSTSKANISDISPKLLRMVHQKQTHEQKKHDLEMLLMDENREALKEYLEKHQLWDFLQAHEEVSFNAQEIAHLLMPLLPRFYSISSSQKHVGNEVHLTVAPVEYFSNGHHRRGVCTHFLCNLVELEEPKVPIFIQPSNHFSLPEDLHAPMLMIGPGTGIAPFRAFLQERLHYHQTKGKHWLFFGEWNRDYDFLYQEDWNEMGTKGHLTIDTAFSRDQAEKIYVQHLMMEKGEEFFRWLEEGAYLYVCGDAKKMARDVDVALHALIQEYGQRDEMESKAYIKQLRHQKRYLRDVY